LDRPTDPPSTDLPIYLPTKPNYRPTYICSSLATYLPIYPPAQMQTYLFIHQTSYKPTDLSTNPATDLPIYPPAQLPTHPLGPPSSFLHPAQFHPSPQQDSGACTPCSHSATCIAPSHIPLPHAPTSLATPRFRGASFDPVLIHFQPVLRF
jgi:hypothetical protein